MRMGRLEAFSDGVIAILITIMVLDLHAPKGTSFSDLSSVAPVALTYVLSFAYLGIYWNNHHHMFQLVERVNGAILWANMHLLFWLSLFPFATSWVGERHFATVPIAVYGVILLMAAIAYYVLQTTIIAAQGTGSRLAAAVGHDLKGKLSPAIYLAAVGLSLLERWVGFGLYVVVALIWLVPDRRVEARFAAELAAGERHDAREPDARLEPSEVEP